MGAKNNREEVCYKKWFRDNCSRSCGLCDCQDSEDHIWIKGGTKKYCNQVDPKSNYCTWKIFQERCEACGLCVPIISNTQSSTNPSLMLTANPSSIQRSSIPTPIPSVISSTKPSSMSTTSPSKNPNDEPSTIPSATPSLITSNIPSTTLSNIPSFVHSPMQSIEPSANPSVYHSVTPTVIPSVVSRTKPSSIPSVSEESIQKCKNKSGKVYMGSIAGLKSCLFLEYLKVVKKEKKCKEENIKTHCYKSCTECNSTLPGEIYSNSPVSSYIPIIKEISAKPSLMLAENSISMPSATPSLIPSDIPSATLSNNPNFVHSSMPIIEPTANPSVYHSVTPTLIPSVVSSTKPSSIPSVSEESIQKCKNKSGKVYMGSIAGLKSCLFLEYLKVVKKEKKC